MGTVCGPSPRSVKRNKNPTVSVGFGEEGDISCRKRGSPEVWDRFSSQVCVLCPLDPEHGDTDPARGGLQHRASAPEPREEPLHGHPAPWPLPAFPHHPRWREQQLHQRRPHGREPPRPLGRVWGDGPPGTVPVLPPDSSALVFF